MNDVKSLKFKACVVVSLLAFLFIASIEFLYNNGAILLGLFFKPLESVATVVFFIGVPLLMVFWAKDNIAGVLNEFRNWKAESNT